MKLFLIILIASHHRHYRCYHRLKNDKVIQQQQQLIRPIAAYYNRQYYHPSYTYGGAQQQQQKYFTKDSFKQTYIDLLKEESEKLFISLEKKLIDEVIDQCVSKTSSSSLPVLQFDKEQQQESSS